MNLDVYLYWIIEVTLPCKLWFLLVNLMAKFINLILLLQYEQLFLTEL